MMIDSFDLIPVHGKVGQMEGFIKGMLMRYDYFYTRGVPKKQVEEDMKWLKLHLEGLSKFLLKVAEGKNDKS